MNCAHKNMVDPPPGKYLRVCLDCCKRIIECSTCDATIAAGSDIGNSGWMKGGSCTATEIISEWYACPGCYYRHR